MSRIPRIGLWALAAAGLVYALIFTVWGGARTRRQQEARQRHEARQARARVAASQTHIRPLDPAVDGAALPFEMKRHVLGLYNSLEPETDAEQNHVHRKAELILNHLGLLVDLHDVNDPLPDDRRMQRYRGVVAWFDGERMRDPPGYLAWLARQMRAGRQVVILEGLGASLDTKGRRTSEQERNQALQELGLELLGNYTDDPHRIQLQHKDSRMVEFERKLPRRLEHYEQLRLTDGVQGRSYLALSRDDIPDSRSDVVVTTARGGYVARGFAIHESRYGTNFVMQWRIDPFAFFARALAVEDTPRPDFTTLGGSRIFYSHIDGDGLPSITEVNRRSMCADFARTEILERYDLPVTASFVVAGIEPPPLGMGNRHRLEVARRIARLPNIEVGVHGFAHPMDWRARDKAVVSYEVPGYKMNAEMEIVHATDYINNTINPPGKAVKVFLWTGWCNPAEDQLALAYKEGLYNLNGGDPVMDGQFPSYLHLAPVMHRVGKLRQYFTSGPNEYILTEEWQEPHYRWANLIQTLENTDRPRRIYPMNVYYHFYVVEKVSALQAMHEIMTWVLRQQPAPLWVSEYIDILRDFEKIRIGQPAGGADRDTWRVLNSGYCRTIRFDRTDRHVDLARSRGVIGYRRLPAQRALYVHLDESHDHTIVLSPMVSRSPLVIRVSGYTRDVVLGPEKVAMTLRGIGRKFLSLANMRPSARFSLRAENEQGKVISATVHTDSVGTLSWQGEINGEAIRLVVTREDRP